ncbi:ATP/GTP-binding protein [Rothia nasimurium]|uniref:ATP/GTP-binding protein n=1 Tax=Rothia nasimurium TaxID=85336 RepID=UPI001F3AF310|nr:ATP/GTP-binding protein [Rothia nasimurium]
MPRRSSSKSRRPNSNSGAAPSKWQKARPAGRDISRILDPAPRVERAQDGDWYVQYIPSINAVKTYKCPECERPIRPGLAHLVVWQQDHMFGSQRAIEERRHWHERCWQTRRFW